MYRDRKNNGPQKLRARLVRRCVQDSDLYLDLNLNMNLNLDFELNEER